MSISSTIMLGKPNTGRFLLSCLQVFWMKCHFLVVFNYKWRKVNLVSHTRKLLREVVYIVHKHAINKLYI